MDETLDNKSDYNVGLIVTYNRNVGNSLTNHALFNVIKDMGYRVLLIDAPNNTTFKKYYEEYGPFGLFNSDNEYKDVDYFISDKINYDELNSRCDMFLLGSDQILRFCFIDSMNYYPLLDWVRSDKFKMSYGTSTGVDYYEGDEQSLEYMRYLLGRFQRIGIREKSGTEYLKKTFGVDAINVMDPVFLCDVDNYDRLAKKGRKRIPNDSYVASYMLDITSDIARTLLYISDRLTGGRYSLILDTETNYEGKANFDLEALSRPSIEEWLSSVKQCSYFVTDSFHGVCFALIYKKPFVVVFDKENWRGYSRIYDILRRLGLTNRIIDKYDTSGIDNILNSEINYGIVWEILSADIQRSREWLTDSLIYGQSWKGRYDQYDAAKEFVKNTYYHTLKNEIDLNNRILRSTVYFNEIAQNTKSSRNYMQKWRDKDMTIVGWGTGDCFFRNINIIKELVDIKYVCDNNPDKWGNKYEGIQCISPGTLEQMRDVAVIIMVDSPGVSFEIADELQEMGISHFDHVENYLKEINGR